MALLSGTKRINRDGGGESVSSHGLLSTNPYAENFVTKSDPRYSAAFGEGISENYGATNPYDAWLNMLPGGDNYWRQFGFSGPTTTEGSDQNDPGMSPELLQFIKDNYQITTDGGHGFNALADASGKYVPGSEYSNRNNDDAAYIAGSIGLALPALWGSLAGNAVQGGGEVANTAAMANGAVSGGASGAGIGGAAQYGGLGMAGMNTLANTLPELTQQAPIESLPQAAAPDLAQVAQVPSVQAGGLTAQEAAAAASSASAFKPSDNYGDGMSGSQTSAYDNTIGATGSPDLANAAGQVVGAGQQAYDWLKQNPAIAKALFGAVAAGSAGSGGGGGYSYSGPMPTIARGNWSPNAQAKSMLVQQVGGLLSIPQTTTPHGNSGLWRYGLLGG